ncbi:MAG: L,D-transpeptidase [Alistipes sp.]|nr:L,D-transpeptidase [Alistipes sp.]
MNRIPILLLAACFAATCGVCAQAPQYIAYLQQPGQAGPVDFEDFIERPGGVEIKKALQYDRHTLADEYDYEGTRRKFQWDKISGRLGRIEALNGKDASWAVLENYKNEHDRPPLAEDYQKEHNVVTDRYGVIQNQSAPLYTAEDLHEPERYGRDGSLVEITAEDDGYYIIDNVNFDGQWYVPEQYVRPIDARQFHRVVFVDRTNQNIATLEKVNGEWYVRSMNPATTGRDNPPYQYATPEGIFLMQDKKEKMFYTGDGSSEIVGYAPYANRFTNGAYIHGVPVNSPDGSVVEYSNTLGTIPRSHMCVRTASSHAEFIYDNFPVDQTLVVVID